MLGCDKLVTLHVSFLVFFLRGRGCIVTKKIASRLCIDVLNKDYEKIVLFILGFWSSCEANFSKFDTHTRHN